jgi:hypothetical protein
MSKLHSTAGTDRADPSGWPIVAWPMLTDRPRALFRPVKKRCDAIAAVSRYASSLPLPASPSTRYLGSRNAVFRRMLMVGCRASVPSSPMNELDPIGTW